MLALLKQFDINELECFYCPPTCVRILTLCDVELKRKVADLLKKKFLFFKFPNGVRGNKTMRGVLVCSCSESTSSGFPRYSLKQI